MSVDALLPTGETQVRTRRAYMAGETAKEVSSMLNRRARVVNRGLIAFGLVCLAFSRRHDSSQTVFQRRRKRRLKKCSPSAQT